MDILYQGISAWTWMPQRPQQLLRAAARAGHRCFFVEHPQGPEGATWSPEPGIVVCRNLAAARRAIGDGYLYYFTNPLLVDELAGLRAGPVLFDALDDFPGVEVQLVRAARAADHVVCTSRAIEQRLRPARPDIVSVPNACDYQHWSAAAGQPPLDVAVLPRPLALFIGAVAQWVDASLLAEAARANPGASFLVIGPHLTDAYLKVDRPANLWAFGRREYAELPACAHAADVLLLPFRAEAQEARAANPVKLWEYLATGKPVVCIDIPEVAPFAPHVEVVPRARFSEAVARALRAPAEDGAAEARRAIAAANTWDDRWRQIEALLGGKPVLDTDLAPQLAAGR